MSSSMGSTQGDATASGCAEAASSLATLTRLFGSSLLDLTDWLVVLVLAACELASGSAADAEVEA